jgi:RHS repeat-associated protein
MYVHDAAGNLSQAIDARNKPTTYSYDAANRLSQIVYQDQMIQFNYDQGINGKGRLTQVTDGSGSTHWTYDMRGRPLTKQQMIGTASFTTSYQYNPSGQLSVVTTPSGQVINYLYINNRVMGIDVNGNSLLNGAMYQPFGPIQRWQWGNGTSTTRQYNMDGRLTTVDSAGISTYTYNLDGSIASHTNGAPGPIIGTTPGLTALAVSATSNQLTSSVGVVARTYTYDEAGNTLSDGTRSFTYNNAGRMSSATNDGVTTTYVYNALGQRVKKSNANGTTYFVYDEAGHLTGEYDTNGARIQEIVWLEDIPVASIRTNQVGDDVGFFYIHTDQLNAPSKMTRPNDNAVVWRWDHDPYGNGAANEDPDGNGQIVSMNLRFPGQYVDQETGLNYNHFRDYDPSIGRYVQSDPIGLDGGLNTYLYGYANPIGNFDPEGLDPLTPSQGQGVANAAAKWIGTPYVYGGSDRKKGADCSGSTWSIYKEAGFSYSSNKVDTKTFVKTMTTTNPTPGKFFPVEKPQPGDIMFWPTHMAIYDSNAANTCSCKAQAGSDMFTANNPTRKLPYAPANSKFWFEAKPTYYRYDAP